MATISYYCKKVRPSKVRAIICCPKCYSEYISRWFHSRIGNDRLTCFSCGGEFIVSCVSIEEIK